MFYRVKDKQTGHQFSISERSPLLKKKHIVILDREPTETARPAKPRIKVTAPAVPGAQPEEPAVTEKEADNG